MKKLSVKNKEKLLNQHVDLTSIVESEEGIGITDNFLGHKVKRGLTRRLGIVSAILKRLIGFPWELLRRKKAGVYNVML